MNIIDCRDTSNIDLHAKAKEIIKALKEAEEKQGYKFYLGGSRAMSKRAALDDFSEVSISIGPGTDFDYYATYVHGDMESFLQNLGFTQVVKEKSEYLDDEAICIYEINTTPKIQVVLRKDAEFYKSVFNNIDLKFYHDFLWKSSPTMKPLGEGGVKSCKPILNQLFKMYRIGYERGMAEALQPKCRKIPWQ